MDGDWSWNQGKDADQMDEDELDYLRAVDRFRQTRRRFPTVLDHLVILKDLGWRKPRACEDANAGKTHGKASPQDDLGPQ